MLRTRIAEELGRLKDILKGFPKGASIEEIEREAIHEGLKWTRRTLQRRLFQLSQDKAIVIKGQSRAMRYFLPHLADGSQERNLDETADMIPLSRSAQNVLEYVKRPLQKREPAGYHRSFLESYQPNKDCYLTSAQVRKLDQIGRIPTPVPPIGTYSKDILDRLLLDLSWNSTIWELLFLPHRHFLKILSGFHIKNTRQWPFLIYILSNGWLPLESRLRLLIENTDGH